jgi:RimJ/RimL family protein N-acetyltransferase
VNRSCVSFLPASGATLCIVTAARLETERLLLRPWRADDAAPLAALNADPAVMRYVGGGETLDRGTSDALIVRFEREWEDRGFGLWAVEERTAPGLLVGFCGLTIPTFLPAVLPAVEVGWRLARDAWGRGLGTECARAAVAFAFDRLGLEEVLAIVHPDNARSLRVCEKLGMTPRPDRVHPSLGVRVRVLGLRVQSYTDA